MVFIISRPVTLVGFSLGARVILSCLETLAESETNGKHVDDIKKVMGWYLFMFEPKQTPCTSQYGYRLKDSLISKACSRLAQSREIFFISFVNLQLLSSYFFQPTLTVELLSGMFSILLWLYLFLLIKLCYIWFYRSLFVSWFWISWARGKSCSSWSSHSY